MTEYDHVLSAALSLGEADRLRLIHDLTASLPDSEVPLSPAWSDEIRRRSQEIDDGTVTTEPWNDVRRRLLKRFHV